MVMVIPMLDTNTKPKIDPALGVMALAGIVIQWTPASCLKRDTTRARSRLFNLRDPHPSPASYFRPKHLLGSLKLSIAHSVPNRPNFF